MLNKLDIFHVKDNGPVCDFFLDFVKLGTACSTQTKRLYVIHCQRF